MKVIFDPGHGGHDPGAIGPTGLRECDVALSVAGLAAQMSVSDGWTIAMTRGADRFASLVERADKANLSQCDVFVSIHCNAATSDKASGYEVWTTRGKTGADIIAEKVICALGRAFPGELARLDKTDGDGDKEAGFLVLKATNCPAILVEMGFISHPETEQRMKSDAWRMEMAQAITEGLNAWRDKA